MRPLVRLQLGVFGEPVKLAEGGRRLDGVDLSEIRFYAAGWPAPGWSVIEAVAGGEAEPDYIITMLRQAAAAIEGTVLDLPPAYENGLGLAHDAAQALDARALVVWGSDEWNSLGGGALIEPSGEIVKACNIADPAQIAKALADREAMDDDSADWDEDDESDEDEDVLFVYAPGADLSRQQVEPIKYIDAWLKELGIAQPELPASLIDAAAEYYGEVWGVRRA